MRATGSGPGRLLRGGRRCVGGWGSGAGREAVKSLAEHIMECAEDVRLYIGCAPFFGGRRDRGTGGHGWLRRAVRGANPGPSGLSWRRAPL